jgi:hypothetical protein
MRKFLVPITLLGLLFVAVHATPAQAQATRTWVSGVGDDVNPCSRTAPCKTFAGAISKTAKDGEISVLDPGGFGTVTITKSITINGTPGAGFGSVLSAGSPQGILINITDPADVRKQVRLNWLDINGASTGTNGIRILSANSVVVENTIIDGVTNRGISDERTTGGDLSVMNSTIRHAVGAGIAVAPSSGATRIDAVISNVNSVRNGFGVAVGSGARVMVKKSVLANNTTAGVEAEGPAGGGEVNVDDSAISSNAIGFQQIAGGTIRLSNNDVAFNTTQGQGTAMSFSNNRFSSNGGGGTVTAIAPAGTNPSGQQ